MAGKELKLSFSSWFDPVWRTALRIMIVGALIGAFGMGGGAAIKTLSSVTITPVMYVGSSLAMAATGISDAAQCVPPFVDENNAMAPISNSFMCIIGNINSVMLAGAAGGFSMMNYAWMGLGGGALTWVAGLLVVIMFLVMGFDLFFQILSVIFKLVFLIIFLPLIVAAGAFEKTWKLAGGILKKSVSMLVESAVKVIAIALKVAIVYSLIFFVADEYFPGPQDGFSVILPPILSQNANVSDPKALSVKNVFSKCESESLVDGVVDKHLFRDCFLVEKAKVESQYPGAFDFMHNGFWFIIIMATFVFIYFYILGPRIDKLLASVPSIAPFKNSGESESGGIDNFGEDLKKMTKMTWKKPQEWAEKLIKK